MLHFAAQLVSRAVSRANSYLETLIERKVEEIVALLPTKALTITLCTYGRYFSLIFGLGSRYNRSPCRHLLPLIPANPEPEDRFPVKENQYEWVTSLEGICPRNMDSSLGPQVFPGDYNRAWRYKPRPKTMEEFVFGSLTPLEAVRLINSITPANPVLFDAFILTNAPPSSPFNNTSPFSHPADSLLLPLLSSLGTVSVLLAYGLSHWVFYRGGKRYLLVWSRSTNRAILVSYVKTVPPCSKWIRKCAGTLPRLATICDVAAKGGYGASRLIWRGSVAIYSCTKFILEKAWLLVTPAMNVPASSESMETFINSIVPVVPPSSSNVGVPGTFPRSPGPAVKACPPASRGPTQAPATVVDQQHSIRTREGKDQLACSPRTGAVVASVQTASRAPVGLRFAPSSNSQGPVRTRAAVQPAAVRPVPQVSPTVTGPVSSYRRTGNGGFGLPSGEHMRSAASVSGSRSVRQVSGPAPFGIGSRLRNSGNETRYRTQQLLPAKGEVQRDGSQGIRMTPAPENKTQQHGAIVEPNSGPIISGRQQNAYAKVKEPTESMQNGQLLPGPIAAPFVETSYGSTPPEATSTLASMPVATLTSFAPSHTVHPSYPPIFAFVGQSSTITLVSHKCPKSPEPTHRKRSSLELVKSRALASRPHSLMTWPPLRRSGNQQHPTPRCTLDIRFKRAPLPPCVTGVEQGPLVPQPEIVTIVYPRVRALVSGLQNLGNTCYMNAVIQCLFSSILHFDLSRPAFVWPNADGDGLVAVFIRLLRQMALGGVVNPVEFRSAAMRALGSGNTFEDYRQQDAEEFFGVAINLLQEESEPATHQGRLVGDAFRGMIGDARRCHNCGLESDLMLTSLLSLHLGIDGADKSQAIVMLDDCLDNHMRDTLDGFKCDGCGMRDTTEGRTAVSELPATLCICLKRFGYDGAKSHTEVVFPRKDLDISRHCTAENASGFRYDLIGVIHHLGATMDSGHYTASILVGDAWWRCNDTQATCIYEASDSELVDGTAYMLFYKRVSV